MRGWLLTGLLLAGCAHVDEPLEVACTPIEVVKPVALQAKPDAALLAPLAYPDVAWYEPADAAASSCVSAAGEQALLDLVDACVARVEAWRAWVAEPLR